MRTSTLIVIVASAASVLLLAVPKKGSEGSSNAPGDAPFVPKIRAMEPEAPSANAERLRAQLLRMPTLDWGRDPFVPIQLAREPKEPEPPARVEPAPQAPDQAPPVEITAPARTGPLPVLSGISQSGIYRFAIVDRVIVEEGDVLSSGDLVMSIGHRTVTLRHGEEIIVIRLGDGR